MSIDTGHRTLPASPRSGWGVLWRGALVTTVLAGLAAFLGARLGSEPPPLRAVPLGDRIFELLGDGLELTGPQREAIAAIVTRYSPVRERLRLQSRSLNVTLVRLMAEEQEVGPKTRQALADLQEVMGERLMLSMQYMLEVRQLLTPAQREMFDRHVAVEASLSR